ncbi:MAG: hypothetical protein U9O06_14290 [Euryarchaeota archaeon]|nr:hypothetical protein [Euryarchaeota archaeon]
MDRRTYLVVGGTVAVSGCLGVLEDEESQPDQDAETTAEPDPEQEATAPDSEGADSQTETSEPEQEPEPESEPEGDDRQQTDDEIELERSISRAEDQFRRALSEYGRSAEFEEPTLLHVLPSTEIETNNAREHLNRASDILWTESRDLATTEDQRQQVREYRTYDDLITDLATIQRYIHGAYSRIGSTDDEEIYSSGPSELASAKRDHEALGKEIADKEMYMTELQTKFEQQRWQIELVERMFAGLVTVKGTAYIDDQSATQLDLARSAFETVRNELRDTTSAPPDDVTDEAFLELVEAWYELTDQTFRDVSTDAS